MPRHPPEPLEPNVRRRSDIDEYPKPSARPESQQVRRIAYARLTHSPANAEAAGLYRENMKEYVRRIKATVEQSWVDESDSAPMATD